MKLSPTLTRCLDDLAARIDETQEAAHGAAWLQFVRGEVGAGVFVPPSRTPRPAAVDWPVVCINDALHDREAMLLQQFGAVSRVLAEGGNASLGVRCNYGVSILTSQLGCPVVEMPREQGNLPTTQPLPGGEAAIDALLDAGVPDLRAGQGGDVFDTAELYLEVMARWPVIGRWVELYHPDTQGPMDNVDLLWGSDVFLAFYDCPQRVHAAMDLMAEHYVAFLSKWFELVPTDSQLTRHWGMSMPGRVMLRDDSLMNLSSQIYVEFIREPEQRCLRALRGGVVHFCGRGDHFIDAMCEMDGLRGINLSQPHLNNMHRVFDAVLSRGLVMVGLRRDAAAACGRELMGKVHCSEAVAAPIGAAAR